MEPGQSALALRPSLLLWCWLIGWLLFVTAARSKLVTYLWPAFPPVAILAAVAWTRSIDGALVEKARRSFARTFVWSSWSGPIVLPTVVFVVQLLLNVRFPWPVWAATAVVTLLVPLPLIPWRAGRRRAALAAAALSLTVQFTLVMTMILPLAAEKYSARVLAEHFNRAGKLPARLFVVEERIGSIVFYLDAELRAGLAAEKIDRLSLAQPPRLTPGDAVAVPSEKLDKSKAALGLGDGPGESAGRFQIFRITESGPSP